LCLAAVAPAFLPADIHLDRGRDFGEFAIALLHGRLCAGHVFDLEGSQVDPLRVDNGRLKVFFFVDAECPISNRYAPEVRRYCTRFGPQGVDFALVYCDEDISAQAIRAHMKQFSFGCPGLRDLKHELAIKAKVHVTPECAVFTSSGKLVYHGRIDNRYADFGKMRPVPTRRELEEAIGAALKGETPACDATPAIGCRIADLP
jgi:hypothetical protein